MELGNMGGTDPAGFTGLKDKVDNHYWRVFGSATLLSIISAVALYTQNNSVGQNTGGISGRDELTAELGRSWSEVGQEMARRNLQIQPTIEIRPGNRLNVMVNRDLIMAPYSNWPLPRRPSLFQAINRLGLDYWGWFSYSSPPPLD